MKTFMQHIALIFKSVVRFTFYSVENDLRKMNMNMDINNLPIWLTSEYVENHSNIKYSSVWTDLSPDTPGHHLEALKMYSSFNLKAECFPLKKEKESCVKMCTINIRCTAKWLSTQAFDDFYHFEV